MVRPLKPNQTIIPRAIIFVSFPFDIICYYLLYFENFIDVSLKIVKIGVCALMVTHVCVFMILIYNLFAQLFSPRL